MMNQRESLPRCLSPLFRYRPIYVDVATVLLALEQPATISEIRNRVSKYTQNQVIHVISDFREEHLVVRMPGPTNYAPPAYKINNSYRVPLEKRLATLAGV